MQKQETLQEYNPGIDRIWSSFAHKQEQEANIPEKFQLPAGFITEKGSHYRYNLDGSIYRSKFDGTEHTQGLAVFLPDDDDITGNSLSLITFHQSESSERKRNTYVVEFEGAAGEVDYTKFRKIYNTSDILNPDRLALVLLNQEGTFDAASQVSIQPVKGTYVFEMSKLPDGSTSRHPGHKVVDIIH